jgi:ADP-ribose pyrophosphatase
MSSGEPPSSRAFEPLGGETLYSGRIVDVRMERFLHADGEEVSREIVRHRGAVGILAYDEETVWLVRQPREAVGEPDLLEIPAGRLDKEGEEPLQTAKRELAEEIGRGAERWEAIVTYYSGAGFTDEQVHLFAATELYEANADSGEQERIEIIPWPIECLADAMTLIALYWLTTRLNA